MACINTIGLSPENSPYGWFSHHRLSINLSDQPDPEKKVSDLKTESDTTAFDAFEFILEDSATMLPADELFSDGKLVPRLPMQFSVNPPEVSTSTTTILSGEDSRRNIDESDPYLFSPRAPRCSSRWKELLGFKKLNQSDNKRTTSFPSSNTTGTTRSIRQLLYRNSKTSHDSSIHLPLLNNSVDNESASVSSSRSSRPSISSSSSSSGHDIDDLPRLSIDSDKKLSTNHPKTRPVITKTQQPNDLRCNTRVGRTRRRTTDVTLATATNRCLSVDSPRINSSGKIVFHSSLERSSSSPSSLIGGSRLKHRGMERSYSGNVRVTPVLNVPVCKSGGMFGFQMFGSSSSSSNCGGLNRSQRFNGKSRPDC